MLGTYIHGGAVELRGKAQYLYCVHVCACQMKEQHEKKQHPLCIKKMMEGKQLKTKQRMQVCWGHRVNKVMIKPREAPFSWVETNKDRRWTHREENDG